MHTYMSCSMVVSYVHAERHETLSWQFCSLPGGVAVPRHEAWRQQNISARRGHLRLVTWPLASPALRSVQESVWSRSLYLTVVISGALCFIHVSLSKARSSLALREIILSQLHDPVLNNYECFFFFCISYTFAIIFAASSSFETF